MVLERRPRSSGIASRVCVQETTSHVTCSCRCTRGERGFRTETKLSRPLHGEPQPRDDARGSPQNNPVQRHIIRHAHRVTPSDQTSPHVLHINKLRLLLTVLSLLSLWFARSAPLLRCSRRMSRFSRTPVSSPRRVVNPIRRAGPAEREGASGKERAGGSHGREPRHQVFRQISKPPSRGRRSRRR